MMVVHVATFCLFHLSRRSLRVPMNKVLAPEARFRYYPVLLTGEMR
jgi:hypothetical protein